MSRGGRGTGRSRPDRARPPYPPIPAPEPLANRLLRWADFPGSLQQEVEAYRQRMLTSDMFDGKHKLVRPVTIENYLARLRTYLTGLARDGMPPEHFMSLARLVKISTVKRGLELRVVEGKLDDQRRLDLTTIVVPLCSVANFIGIDEAHRRELSRIGKKVRHRQHGMNAKNKERLVPLLGDKMAMLRLVYLPAEIAHELRKVKEPTVRQAQLMQMACLLDFLLHVPARIKNAAELDMAENIACPAGGQAGSWRIAIAAEDVKNKVAIDAQLSEGTSALLDRYVTVFRPVLPKQPTAVLFVSQKGCGKGPSALSKQFSRFVHARIGLTVHAHLMRHFAAHLFLKDNPGCYEDVRRMLGHKSLTTTISFFAGLETDRALARYSELISSLRKDIRIASLEPAPACDEEEAA